MSPRSSGELCSEVVAGACRILEQSGEAELARVLSRLTLALHEPEQWTLSGRAVDAYLAVLLVPSDLILRVRSDTPMRDKMRAALAAAFDTPARVLRDLSVMLDDTAMRISASDALTTPHPYRDSVDPGALPHPAMLRSAAQTYAAAAGDGPIAELLTRTRVVVEQAAAIQGERRANLRLALLVGLDDLARLGRDPGLRDRLVATLRAVAQGPGRVVGDIAIGPDWSLPAREAPAVQHAARRAVEVLRDLLAAEGVASVVTHAGERGIRLVASIEGRVAVVDVVDGPPAQATLPVVHVRVDQNGHDLAEAARAVRRALQRVGQE